MHNISVLHDTPVWLDQTKSWIYGQVHQLQRLGMDVHVLCERVRHLDQFNVDNIHCLAEEPLLRRLWYKASRFGGLRRRQNFLIDVGRKVNAQIVHSHFGHVGWHHLDAVRKLGAKHVVTFYGFDVNKLPTQFPEWRQRYIELFESVSLVLCEGSHMGRCIMELGCPAEKIRVQHLGADVEKIKFSPRVWQPDEPLRILIAATFREKKGIPDAIAAVGRLRDKLPIILTIIGDANPSNPESYMEKEKVLEAIARNDLSEQTRLLGYQSYEALIDIAYQHHIFLSPSVTASDGDTEGGAPVSLIEMAASGMPLVSTFHCDIPEVVLHGVTGLLAAEHDIDGLVRHLEWLAANHDKWEGMLVAGRMHIEKEYHSQRQGEKLFEAYRYLTSQ